jgi:hypothetical protein
MKYSPRAVGFPLASHHNKVMGGGCFILLYESYRVIRQSREALSLQAVYDYEHKRRDLCL